PIPPGASFLRRELPGAARKLLLQKDGIRRRRELPDPKRWNLFAARTPRTRRELPNSKRWNLFRAGSSQSKKVGSFLSGKFPEPRSASQPVEISQDRPVGGIAKDEAPFGSP